ncbi:MAG: class I fructose-bisphosphate aldolase, partial [Candidatus Peregrinibacteria bacterium]|nr:class I fructose-bisphosphate aldolase [Candidatus Peregrinibacteria bacterium]
AGLVPIVEPEVIITGIHDINRSYDVTSRVLEALFTQLKAYKIDLAGLILKTSMVISGQECTTQDDAATVSDYTVRCLKNIEPAEIGGIVFLSGGQSAEQSTKNLDAINRAATDAPWQLTFSYARALQGPSLKLWNGKDSNIPEARMKFLERLRANSSARMGEHDSLKKV